MPSKVISGSSKVVGFGTNRKRVFDFLLVTFVVSRTVSEIRRLTGASIPIYRWRQMRHGNFGGGDEKSILGEMKKFNIKSVNFVHKFNNLQFSQSQKSGLGVSRTMEGR